MMEIFFHLIILLILKWRIISRFHPLVSLHGNHWEKGKNLICWNVGIQIIIHVESFQRLIRRFDAVMFFSVFFLSFSPVVVIIYSRRRSFRSDQLRYDYSTLADISIEEKCLLSIHFQFSSRFSSYIPDQSASKMNEEQRAFTKK